MFTRKIALAFMGTVGFTITWSALLAESSAVRTFTGFVTAPLGWYGSSLAVATMLAGAMIIVRSTDKYVYGGR